MKINLAHIEQLTEVFAIFCECRAAMQKENIFQWTDAYPTIDIASEDILNKQLFSLTHNGKCVGVITINTIQAAAYNAISWRFPGEKALVIHRLAVDPLHQKQGIATRLMDFAEDYAVTAGYSSIRLDSNSSNTKALRFYRNRGYEERGEVYFPGRTLPFSCFEKQLTN